MRRAAFWAAKALQVLAGLLTGVIACALLILWKPEVVVNPETLRWADERYFEGMELSWDEMAMDVDSRGLLDKELSVRFREFCYRASGGEGGAVELCFDRGNLGLRAAVSIISGVERLRLLPSELHGGRLLVRAATEEDADVEEGANPAVAAREAVRTVVGWLDRIEIESLDATMDEIRIVSAESSLSGSAGLHAKGSSSGVKIGLAASGWRGTPFEGAENRASLRIESWPDQTGVFPASFNATADLTLAGGVRIDGTVSFPRLTADVFPTRLAVDGGYSSGDDELRARADFELGEERVSGEFAAEFRRAGAGMDVRVEGCRMTASWTRIPAGSDLSCRVSAAVPSQVDRLVRDGRMPERLSGRLSAGVEEWAPTADARDTRVKGRAVFEMDPFRGDGTRISGSATLRVDGHLDEFSRFEGLGADWNIDAGFDDFSVVKEVIESYGVTVPAPARSFRGPVFVGSEGGLRLTGNRLSVPVKAVFDLCSKNQSFDATLNGDLVVAASETASGTGVSAELLIEDVQLVIPRWPDATVQPPPLVPDSRIASGVDEEVDPFEEREKASAVKYGFSVRTARKGAFKIKSNRARKPVELSLDLRMSDEVGPVGRVRVHPVVIEAFNREANLDYLVLDLKPEMVESEISGELTVEYTEYTITARLLGTVGDTTIQLTSDPPLPEEDIVGVLLFGRPVDELTYGEGESVAALQSAVSGGMSLASFYLLSATPIEQVYYDPQTGRVAARVRLSGGRSVTLGLGGGTQAVGGRQRLGNNWVIGGEVIRDVETGEKILSTFIEWHFRY